jgi:hypothetical protein
LGTNKWQGIGGVLAANSPLKLKRQNSPSKFSFKILPQFQQDYRWQLFLNSKEINDDYYILFKKGIRHDNIIAGKFI